MLVGILVLTWWFVCFLLETWNFAFTESFSKCYNVQGNFSTKLAQKILSYFLDTGNNARFIENIEVDQYRRDIISHPFSFPQFHSSTDNVMPLPCPV